MKSPTREIAERLAYNLRWAWHAPTAALFHELAPKVWDQTHNPVAVLNSVDVTAEALDDHTDRLLALHDDLENYLIRVPQLTSAPRVAYFSAEFAVADCLPIYAGGLGVLAGDHLKTASDIGLPVIGVGLLYSYGYFHQEIGPHGNQREDYARLDIASLPLRGVLASDGAPLHVGVPFPGRTVVARVWLARVGRVALYLLDTNLARNREDDRWITGHLYGGDRDTRLRQELLLGVGGIRLVRALRLLGLEVAPQIYHLNEGHSAFAALERAAELMRGNDSSNFFMAHERAARTIAFTTHTPTAAGHDVFPAELIEAYLADYRQQLGLTHTQFMSIGRRNAADSDEDFSMTVLALRSAHARNAVSQLHGEVSRRMWSGVGVGAGNVLPKIEMAAITNGVHMETWAGPEMTALFDASLSPMWRTTPHDPSAWTRLRAVDSRELWAARGAQRARLLRHIERLSGRQLPSEDPLILGFARRFTTYKRAGLLLLQPERLAQLLGSTSHPVVLVLAGKAHPYDEPGRLLIQRIVEASADPRFGGRLIFLANYEVELARLLVQGSDVWLNTPRRLMEASGTSGMKATLNGSLHVSELDGWWDEAYAPGFGWAIGGGLPDDVSDDVRDHAEALQLIDLLENEIAPLFFRRDAQGTPAQWLERVKRSIVGFAGTFSAHRMVTEYVEQIYQPLADRALVEVQVTSGRREAAFG
jgi:starch phosphorylase